MIILFYVFLQNVKFVWVVYVQICVGIVEFGLRKLLIKLFGYLWVMNLIILISRRGVVLLSVWVRLMMVLVRMFGMVSGRIWWNVVCIFEVLMLRVVLWMFGGIVFRDVWVEMMIVGSVISVSIRLLISGVDCGKCMNWMNIVNLRMLNMMDGIVVRFEILILIRLVNLFFGVNFFRQIDVVILIGRDRNNIMSIMKNELIIDVLMLVFFGLFMLEFVFVMNGQLKIDCIMFVFIKIFMRFRLDFCRNWLLVMLFWVI